ncbi:splicing coactivator [Purpureocillium lavendulum]|uniref:Splicing coactivator n=1 Tax=Purpureocillium lavendulum TaxID=1247861 RepID=A0AB34FRW5_9HYPO|nr:splicing coactivator [Purpureocillium lavendulum]
MDLWEEDSASPPPYEDNSTRQDAPTTARPETLFIAQRFIHAGGADGPAVYELSHHIDYLTDTDHKVVMQKLTQTLRDSAGAPSVRTRKRPMFHLTHRTVAEMPNFSYQAEAQARLAPPHMGILRVGHKIRSGRRRYRVVRTHWGDDNRLQKSDDVLFEAEQPTGTGNADVVWEWSDGNGAMLAREVLHDDGILTLVVTAEMGIRKRDALAAAWVMRIWWDVAENGPAKEGLRNRAKRIMRKGCIVSDKATYDGGFQMLTRPQAKATGPTKTRP